MEPSDLPLVVPMTSTINAMFKSTFDELDEMKQALHLEDNPPKPEGADTPAQPTPEEIQAAAKEAAKKPGGKQSKKEKERLAKEQALAEEKAAAAAANRELGLNEDGSPIVQEADLPPKPKDAWREKANEIQAEEDALLSSHKKPHAWMQERLEYLNSGKQIMIEDILGEWVEPLEHIPEGVIDAIQMANDHSEMLHKKFGYVPPRGLHEVGKVEPWDQTADANSAKFKTHSAGGKEMETDFVCAASLKKFPQPPQGDTSSSPATNTRRRRHQSRRNNNGSARAALSSDNSGSDGDMGSLRNVGGAGFSSGGESSGEEAVLSSKKAVTGKADGAHTLMQSTWGVQRAVPKPLIPDVAIELSTNRFTFTNCFPGSTYVQTLTVWNRDSGSRRFKIAPMPTPMIQVKPVKPKTFDCDVPVVPGTPIEFEISYTPVQAKCYNGVIQFGHCRNLNATAADKSEASQWTFIDIAVEATSMEPHLALDAPLDIDPCFAFSREMIVRTLTNTGCAGVFTLSTPFPFQIEPKELILEFGESRQVEITFTPDKAGEFEADITVSSKLLNDPSRADDKFTDSFPVCGEAHLPEVYIESLGGAKLEMTQPQQNGGGDVPFAFLEDTCEGLTSQKHVAVRNNGPLPISYEWHNESSGTCESHIMPPTGVLAPERTTIFVVEVTPHKAECLESIFKLMLVGLPEVPAGFDCPPQLARKKRQPVLGKFAASNFGATDPFQLFNQEGTSELVDTAEQPGSDSDVDEYEGDAEVIQGGYGHVFSCAIRLAADPTEMKAHLVPEEMSNDVPSLIQQVNHREFLLTNDCACDLEFWINPPRGLHHPGAVLDEEGKKKREIQLYQLKEMVGENFRVPTSHVFENLDIQFNPQRAMVPGNSSVTIAMSYTLKKVGPVDIDIECFMPQLGERSPSLRLLAEGQGPTVHPSATFIDFGIIPKDGEGEARLSLANHSPIPLVWKLQDNQAALSALSSLNEVSDAREEGNDEENRFCFLPETGPLKPRAEVEVTVYLRGSLLEVGPFREQVQVAVENGVSKWIEVRACIQEPRCHITPSTLEFKNVDRDVYTEGEVFLHNDSAVDIQYELQVLKLPENGHLEITLPQPRGTLFSGIKNQPIPIQAIFHGEYPSTAAVAVVSSQLRETPVFEVTCDSVQQLAVCLSLRAGESGSLQTPRETNTRPKRQTPASFFRSLLDNLVIKALELHHQKVVEKQQLATAQAEEESSEQSDSRRDSTDRPASSASPALSIPRSLGAPSTLPYCPPLQFTGCRISDGIPYFVTAATLKVDNTSGCATKFNVFCEKYVPFLPGELTLASSAALGTATLVKAANHQLQPLASTGTAGPLKLGSVGGTKVKGSVALVPAVSQSPFSCKQRDGRGDREAEEQFRLGRCTQLLLDGKGAALELKNATGHLQGHDASDVRVTFWTNLPGRYTDKIHIKCDGLPSAVLDVSMEVRGKPLLVDPATSGLNFPAESASGTPAPPTLMLPTLVGGMSSVKRKMKITSRCPRDLDARAVLVEAGSFISAEAKDLGGVFGFQAADSTNESHGCGTVSPAEFFLPAMETIELTIEYTPSATMAEPLWQAQLLVTSTMANSVYNDCFLIDEFYSERKSELPTTRTIASEALVANANRDHMLRGVNKIFVRTPLVDRPNVVKDSHLCSAEADEFQVNIPLQKKKLGSSTMHGSKKSFVNSKNQALGSSSALQKSQQQQHSIASLSSKKFDPGMDMDSDNEKDELSPEEREMEERAKRNKLAKAGEERERTVLKDWLDKRRNEESERTDCFLEPILVNVMARTVEAKLSCDPKNIVKFPFCMKGSDNTRVLHLSNDDVAPLDFRIEVDAPFGVQDINFVPHKGAKSGKPNDTLLAGLSTFKQSKKNGSTLGARSVESNPLNTLFQLRPLDELDVVLKLEDFTLEAQSQVDGELRILFNNGTKQKIPLLATVHVPALVAEPAELDFVPPVIVDDGKQQPRYSKIIKLSNRSLCDAKFFVRHLPANRPLSRATKGPKKQDKVLQTLKEKPEIEKGAAFVKVEEKRKLLASTGAGGAHQPLGISSAPTQPTIVDDPSRFRITPMSGVVPAANLSGAPTKMPIEIFFDEQATTEFESKFEIVVEDGVGTVICLGGVSRETEINF